MGAKDINEANLRGENDIKQIEPDDARELDTPADDAFDADGEPREVKREAKKEEKKEKKGPEVGSQFDDARSRAAEKLRKQREEAQAAEFGKVPKGHEDLYYGNLEGAGEEDQSDQSDDADEAQESEATYTEASDEEAAEKLDEAVAGEQQTQKVKLKVNGKIIEVTPEERDALAQKQLATPDKYEKLAQRQALYEEQLKILQQARENQPQSAKEPEVEATPDELDDIIDKIQVGDAAEAKEALNKYGEQLLARAYERVGNVEERVQNAIRYREHQQAVNKVIDEFAQRHPKLNQEPAGQIAVTTEARRIIHQNLLENGISNDDIIRYGRENNLDAADAISAVYREASINGFPLMPQAEVLEKAAANIYATFGQPQPQQPSVSEAENSNAMQERQERKRTVSQQPRRSALPPQKSTRPISPEESRARAVKAMAASRNH